MKLLELFLFFHQLDSNLAVCNDNFCISNHRLADALQFVRDHLRSLPLGDRGIALCRCHGGLLSCLCRISLCLQVFRLQSRLFRTVCVVRCKAQPATLRLDRVQVLHRQLIWVRGIKRYLADVGFHPRSGIIDQPAPLYVHGLISALHQLTMMLVAELVRRGFR